jgi:hypothetical protein
MRQAAGLVLVLLAAACWAAPAHALEDNDLSFTPQFGMAAFGGKAGVFAGPGLAYGLSVAYATNSWLAVEAMAVYSDHVQRNGVATGSVNFTHLAGGLGPRFNWNTKYIVPYISLLGGLAFVQYKANWTVGQYSHSANDRAHALGGMADAGLDFPLHDDFTIGISGFAGALDGTLNYSNKSGANQALGVYGFFGGLIRLSLIF